MYKWQYGVRWVGGTCVYMYKVAIWDEMGRRDLRIHVQVAIWDEMGRRDLRIHVSGNMG